jgi:hypothetical protein
LTSHIAKLGQFFGDLFIDQGAVGEDLKKDIRMLLINLPQIPVNKGFATQDSDPIYP